MAHRVTGYLEAQHASRRRGAFEPIEAQLAHINPYLSLINTHDEEFTAIAEMYYDELIRITTDLRTNRSDIWMQLPEYVREDFETLTLEEFTARAAAVPTTMNVTGWLDDFNQVGLTSDDDEYLTPYLAFAQIALLGIVPPDRDIGRTRPFGDLQSVGYLELRYSEFDNLVSTNQATIGDEAYNFIAFQMQAEALPNSLDLFSTGQYSCAENPTLCFRRYIQASIPGSVVQEDEYRILFEAGIRRFTLQQFAYIDDWQGDNLQDSISTWEPDTVRSFWHRTSPVAYAINYSSIGWSEDPPTERYSYEELQKWAENYDQAIMYFRAIFGSSETSSLVRPSDYNADNVIPSSGIGL